MHRLILNLVGLNFSRKEELINFNADSHYLFTVIPAIRPIKNVLYENDLFMIINIKTSKNEH